MGHTDVTLLHFTTTPPLPPSGGIVAIGLRDPYRSPQPTALMPTTLECDGKQMIVARLGLAILVVLVIALYGRALLQIFFDRSQDR